MVDGAEFSGRTLEDAISQAERELDARRDDLAIQVINQGSRGVFGIGAENARIRVQRRDDIVAAAPARTVTATLERPTSGDVDAEVSPVADSEPLPQEAADVLRTLLRTMGFDVDVTIRSEENPIMLAITGDNLGVLIGRRGDNLAALQFMVNLILSKHRRQWPRIVIDVENYRARREESLRTLADRVAYRVRRNLRPFTLDAMPAGDRRVIHLALRDRSDIETYSIGEGAARRVVIAPRRGASAPASRYSAPR